LDAIDELQRGREAYAGRAWTQAYASLSRADQAAPLGAEDLELLAMSGYAFSIGWWWSSSAARVSGAFDRLLVAPATVRAMRRTLDNLERCFAAYAFKDAGPAQRRRDRSHLRGP